VATGAADRRSTARPSPTARAPQLEQDEREPPGWLPGVALVLVIVAWGLGPPVTKLITAPPLVYVTVRLWASLPALLVLTYATGGRITVGLLRRTWLAGALFGINLVFVFASLHHATVAVVSVISALQPGVIMLVGPIFGERPTRWHLFWTVVGIVGAATVVLGTGPSVHSSPLGILLATAAMLTFTTYFLIVRKVRFTLRISASEWMSGVTLFSAVTVTIPALALERSTADWAQLDGRDLWYLAFVALVVGIGGHVTMSWTTKYIQASRSSLYLLAMNVVAVAAAWPIHHEPLTLLQGLGGLIVLGAVGAVLSRPPAATR
jgi:drug/metabolite transporter (DMT)-like permease